MLKNVKGFFRRFWSDKGGSETTEMVATTAMLICFILIGLSVMAYVVQYNNVNFATKQVVRQIEVTGRYNKDRATNLFNSCVGTSLSVPPEPVEISNVSFLSGNRIQLKDTFRITTRCDYEIPLINPGSFTGYSITLPIQCAVAGMSEVYWW